MLDFLTNKQKGVLGTIALLGVGAIIIKSLYDYSNYKTLKWVEKRLKHNASFLLLWLLLCSTHHHTKISPEPDGAGKKVRPEG